MVDEARGLLDLWRPGMNSDQLFQDALDSGRFPTMSARRLRNLVKEGFAPRLLTNESKPAAQMKLFLPMLSTHEFEQLFFVYTCRANRIFHDFVLKIYWPAYTSGRDTIANAESREFVIRANQDGLTTKPWSESMISRVAGYLTGTCANFGLLEAGAKRVRKILPFRIAPHVAIILTYDLHFSGLGDNGVVSNVDWTLYGLDRADVLDELKRLALKGVFIVQTAGSVIKIGWLCKNMEELRDAIAEG